jgi:TrmH family RNA methyltransferase
MPLHLTSLQNPRVKNLISLQKPRERRRQGVFVVEGLREVSLAQQGGFDIEAFYICEGVYQPDVHYPIVMDDNRLSTMSREVYTKVAYREGTGGVLAVAKMKSTGLADLPQTAAGEVPLYLVIEKVEKPGNIGAMLRTADAAGLSGVIVCDSATDFYNPNVVRSSVGTLFTVPVAAAGNEEARAWLRSKQITTYATALIASKSYHSFDYSGPSAFLLGSESEGLSDFWLEHADEAIIVPMHGKIDSMNVSNIAAVVVFEALRQRAVE